MLRSRTDAGRMPSAGEGFGAVHAAGLDADEDAAGGGGGMVSIMRTFGSPGAWCGW